MSSKSISSPPQHKRQGKKQKPLRHDKRWLFAHSKALKDAGIQMHQTPISTLFTCTVIALTILLTTILFMALRTFQHVTEYIHSSQQVTIYLKSNSDPIRIDNWKAELQQDPIIKDTTYISPREGLQELASSTDYKDLLNGIDDNPLPPVLMIKLNTNDKTAIKQWSEQIRNNPLVSSVNLDIDWLSRLFALLKLGHRLSIGLSILFSVGVVLIISHAIQGATERNQQEMKILQLIGASISYIRRPFLYMGTLLGLLAGIIALLLLAILLLPLNAPLTELLQSYNIALTTSLLSSQIFFYVISISALLGWLGAWLAFYRYARIF